VVGPRRSRKITYGLQWQECDAHGGECKNIPGASAASYTTGAGDPGHTLRVVVNASDKDGLASASSAPSEAIAASSLGDPMAPARPPTPAHAEEIGATPHTSRRMCFDYGQAVEQAEPGEHVVHLASRIKEPQRARGRVRG
jgi:hypothetical protein